MIRKGDVVQYKSAQFDSQEAWIVVDVLDGEKIAIQEICNRILKVERVVDAERLKVLF